MRKIFTIICLMMFFNIMAQSHKIDVRVEDHCQNLFTKPIVLDLYKFSGADTTYIASSTVNPATFTGLDENENYMVKIKSDDKSKTDLNLKDIHLLRQHILGTKPGTKATIYSGDISKDSWVSTLDMVLLSRRLIGYPNINLDNWFFMANNLFTENSSTKYINKVFLNNGSNSATLIAFNKGDISASYFDCTTTCPLDSTIKNTISFPFLDVKKDESIEFEIKFDRNLKNLGYLFSLVYKDLQVESIVTLNGGNHNNISADNTINFINLFFDSAKDLFHGVAKVRVKPFKNGNLASMISLNPNFNAEAIYQTDNCIASNPIFNLINTDLTCPITWPADITVKDCNAVYNTGEPFIVEDCKENTSTSYTDQVFGNPCQKILRTWTVIYWLSSEVSSHIQTITIEPNYKTICLDATIVVDGTSTIYAKDFIKTLASSGVYSFGIDTYIPSKTLTYSKPYIEELTIYDMVSQEFCVAKVTKLECDEKVKILNQTSIPHNGLPYYLVRGNMFDGGNNNICPWQISDFQISEVSSVSYTSTLQFPVQQYKGTTLQLKLRCRINGVFVEQGLVTVSFIDQGILAFKLSCFDDNLEKNKPFEIAFFSPSFININAIQGAIAINDATVLSLKKVKLSEMVVNQQTNLIKLIWLNSNGTPTTFAADDTLFSITVIPNKSGKVSDFIFLDNTALISEVTLNDTASTKISLVFNFLPRIVKTSDIVEKGEVEIHPNPNNGSVLYINAALEGAIKVRITNSNGQVVMNEAFDNAAALTHIDLPSNIPNGMYFVSFYNGTKSITKKLFIAK